MGFLTFLFFAIAGIWLVGIVMRFALTRWLRKRTTEYNRAAEDAKRRGRREGEVTVETTRAATEKKVNRGVGEYVEFEEITSDEEKK